MGFLGFYGFVYFRIQPVTFLLVTMYEWCGDHLQSDMLILPTLLGILHSRRFMSLYISVCNLCMRFRACAFLSF
jgi:hypothetical protein